LYYFTQALLEINNLPPNRQILGRCKRLFTIHKPGSGKDRKETFKLDSLGREISRSAGKFLFQLLVGHC
jgi:hypothetical protein